MRILKTTGMNDGFSHNGGRFQISETQMMIGVVILLAFSLPLGYASYYDQLNYEMFGKVLFGLTLLLGAVCVFHRKIAVFDKNTGRFEYKNRFIVPTSSVSGPLSDMEYLELETLNIGGAGGGGKIRNFILFAGFQGQKLRLCYSNEFTNLETARRLAVLAGVPLRLTGEPSYWGVTEDNDDYEESALEAERKLGGAESG